MFGDVSGVSLCLPCSTGPYLRLTPAVDYCHIACSELWQLFKKNNSAKIARQDDSISASG